MRVWIDTDVGANPDDAIALLLARAHPDVELVGVSTVGGDRVARAQTVPAFLGSGFRHPIVYGGDVGSVIRGGAPDAVVAVGPLTSVAAADISCPVTIMGGALAPVVHRGRVRRAESNFAADPAAAREALRRHFCRVVPLDVTREMTVAGDAAAALRGVNPELGRQLDAWPHPLVLHDPLALLVAIDDVDYAEDRMRITVDRRGRVVEGRGIEQRVVVDADTDGAIERILSLLT